LTGRWPYEEELSKRKAVEKIEERFPQVRAQRPESPAKYADLPKGLDAVVLKCLEYDPQKRFPAVRAMVSEFAKYLEGSDRMWPESLGMSKSGNTLVRNHKSA